MGGTVRDCLSVRFCHRCEEERRISQWQWPGHHTPQILLWWKGKKNPFWNYVANVSCFITEAGLMTGINPFQVKSWFSGCHTRFPLVKLSISLSHHLSSIVYHLSSIVYSWLDFGLPPHCPQVVWCRSGEIEPFSTTLVHDGLAECDQAGRNPLKYSAMAGNWTREDRQWAIPLTYHDWLSPFRGQL